MVSIVIPTSLNKYINHIIDVFHDGKRRYGLLWPYYGDRMIADRDRFLVGGLFINPIFHKHYELYHDLLVNKCITKNQLHELHGMIESISCKLDMVIVRRIVNTFNHFIVSDATPQICVDILINMMANVNGVTEPYFTLDLTVRCIVQIFESYNKIANIQTFVDAGIITRVVHPYNHIKGHGVPIIFNFTDKMYDMVNRQKIVNVLAKELYCVLIGQGGLV
jgi:hypothetical protein